MNAFISCPHLIQWAFIHSISPPSPPNPVLWLLHRRACDICCILGWQYSHQVPQLKEFSTRSQDKGRASQMSAEPQVESFGQMNPAFKPNITILKIGVSSTEANEWKHNLKMQIRRKLEKKKKEMDIWEFTCTETGELINSSATLTAQLNINSTWHWKKGNYGSHERRWCCHLWPFFPVGWTLFLLFLSFISFPFAFPGVSKWQQDNSDVKDILPSLLSCPDAHPAVFHSSLLNKTQKRRWKRWWIEIKARRSLSEWWEPETKLNQHFSYFCCPSWAQFHPFTPNPTPHWVAQDTGNEQIIIFRSFFLTLFPALGPFPTLWVLSSGCSPLRSTCSTLKSSSPLYTGMKIQHSLAVQLISTSLNVALSISTRIIQETGSKAYHQEQVNSSLCFLIIYQVYVEAFQINKAWFTLHRAMLTALNYILVLFGGGVSPAPFQGLWWKGLACSYLSLPSAFREVGADVCSLPSFQTAMSFQR